MENNQETKIQHLRNLMTPIKNYFKLQEEALIQPYELSELEIIGKYIKLEREQCIKNLPEILEILKQIPDDCAGLREE